MKVSINKLSIILGVGFGTMLSCQPDEFGPGNGLKSAGVTAPSFNVTPVVGKTNTYVFTADKKGTFGQQWDVGDGGLYSFGSLVDTVVYPDAGEYTVKYALVERGGERVEAPAQKINIDKSDPVAGNLVVGGRFGDASDISNWTVVNISPGVSWTFADGVATAKGGSWGHQAIYQAIDVEADKKYMVDLIVSGKGASDVWFEVYVGTKKPADTGDYSDGGIRIALNTWNGCGKTAFSGKLSKLSCAGNGNTFKFDAAGTVYLLIKTGGSNLGDGGISIDNVELRGVK